MVILLEVGASILLIGFGLPRLVPSSWSAPGIRKAFGVLLALGVCGAIGTQGYHTYRDRELEHLYKEIVDPESFQNSVQTRMLVARLAKYGGPRATEMLLSIALSDNLLTNGARDVAMNALAKTNDPAVARSLANLLQPHQTLGTRQMVTGTLQDLPCDTECTGSILHYLERAWRGEPSYDDRMVDPIDPQKGIADTQRAERTLYEDLCRVLRREKVATLTVLVRVYGLGSDDPSLFALDLVSHLEVREACGTLLQSEKALEAWQADLYKAPSKEVQAAIASLKCK